MIRRPFSTSAASSLLRARSLRSNRSYPQSRHAPARRSSAFIVRASSSSDALLRRSNPPSALETKERTDSETNSTTERIRSQSFALRSRCQRFNTDSVRSSSASSTVLLGFWPRPFRSEVTANNALQRTAPGCHGSCYSRSGVSPSFHLFPSSDAASASYLRSYRASPPRSLSFGSLGDLPHA